MKPILIARSLLVPALLIVSITGAVAQPDASLAIDLKVDEAGIVRLRQDAATVVLGNPLIADITVEGPRLLVATGKAAGRTNLVILDADGAEIASGSVSVAAGTAGTVFLYHGAKRQSLYCAPLCEGAISAGDDADTFDTAISTQAKKRASSIPASSRKGAE